MSDLIKRQAAIDALATGEELLKRVLDDMDVVGNEREKYEWGLGLIESYIADMKELPSAQSEIIQCKDCKHSEHWYGDKCRCFLWHETGIDVFEDGFCNYAERKGNG